MTFGERDYNRDAMAARVNAREAYRKETEDRRRERMRDAANESLRDRPGNPDAGRDGA